MLLSGPAAGGAAALRAPPPRLQRCPLGGVKLQDAHQLQRALQLHSPGLLRSWGVRVLHRQLRAGVYYRQSRLPSGAALPGAVPEGCHPPQPGDVQQQLTCLCQHCGSGRALRQAQQPLQAAEVHRFWLRQAAAASDRPTAAHGPAGAAPRKRPLTFPQNIWRCA